jgi:peptidoglycan/xylan/chitin deacetylase (PgdA/CDA1 family)
MPRSSAGTWATLLCYHSISESDPYISISPKVFRAQLEDMRQSKIRLLTMTQMLAIADGKDQSASPGLTLTFDDGYQDFQEAAELLRDLDIPSALAVTGAAIDSQVHSTTLPSKKNLLEGATIRRLADSGVSVLAHGMTHVPLTRIDRVKVRQEIRGSRERIEDLCGRPCLGFVFPFGDYDSDVIAEVQDAGFEFALTLDGGIVAAGIDRFQLPRYSVNYFTDPAFLTLLTSRGLPTYVRFRRKPYVLNRDVYGLAETHE